MSTFYNIDFVPPHRREEVLRRIRLLDAYIEQGRDKGSAADFADELGLSVAQFFNLARIWRKGKDPSALFGASRPSVEHDRLSDGQRNVILEAISRLPDAAHEDVARLASEIAKKQSVEMPVFSTIRQFVRRQRRGRLPSSSPAVRAHLVVEHCAINVGVKGDDGGAYIPVATICTSVGDAKARAVRLSLECPTAAITAAVIADALAASHMIGAGDGTSAIYLDLLSGSDWINLGDVLNAAGIDRIGTERDVPRRADSTLWLLGSRIAALTLHPRMTNRPFKDRPAKLARGAKPVELVEAEAFVKARLVRGNSDRLELGGPGGTRLQRLLRDLANVGM